MKQTKKNRSGNHRGNDAFGPLYTPKEDAFIRENYSRSATFVAKELGRTRASVVARAQRLGGIKRLMPWTSKDDERLRMSWGPLTIKHIAQAMGRTERAIYHRARTIGLGLGCPQGYEYISNAAARTCYDEAPLRNILRWAGVKILRAIARPGFVRKSNHVHHIVEPHDVDEAIIAWLATETPAAAARRHGYEPNVVRRLALEAIARGDTRIRPPPARGKRHWRIPSSVIDELFVAYLKLETCLEAAKRHGVRPITMKLWLGEAGLRTGRGVKIDPAKVDAIIESRRSSETIEEAARRHDRSGPYVRDVVFNAIERGELTAPTKRFRARWRLPAVVYDELIAKHIAGESGRRASTQPRHLKKSASATALARVA